MSESLNVSKFECLKVWMSESLNVSKSSFSKLEQLEFEGRLERKLRFQSLNEWNLKEISQESVVFKA